MPSNAHPFVRKLSLALALCFSVPALAALTPDQIVLIVNRNVPESAELAAFYAKARGIPDGRVIALDLPFTEDMSFDAYERSVAPAVRGFLESNGLRDRAKCLVTFYGVPLKVRDRVNTSQDSTELATLKQDLATAVAKLSPIVTSLEKLAIELNPSFRALSGPEVEGVEGLARRAELAAQSLGVAVQRIDDPQKRQEQLARLMGLVKDLRQPVQAVSIPPAPKTTQASTASAATAPAALTAEQVRTMSAPELNRARYDPGARRRLRELSSAEGLIGYTRVVGAQVEYLSPDATEAAFDSELALVLWPSYDRRQWQMNVLNWRFATQPSLGPVPPVLMVSRLDAPKPQQVRDMIARTLSVEREGLKGRLVVDAGGAAKLDPGKKNPIFWRFEQTLGELAQLVKSKAPDVQVAYDEKPDILPPASVTDVAMYVGWYSVGNYVPSCRFAPGAVAYHIASFELTSLRDPNNKGWCPGLINDGVVATLGPVGEPYLHAFPAADEFFALLMTGKLTLVEVYWRTTPLSSWKIALIGDPLYTPFAARPQIKPANLPPEMRPLLSGTQN